MDGCKESRAVKNLLREDTPEEFMETLDTMFEAWLCSNAADGTTGDQRATKLTHTKALKQLLQSI